jgi:uncharacterized iron-regulated membrane protein
VIRKTLFWIHLVIGLSSGALILLMSVTGVMLGFERQMIAWIDGHPRVEARGDALPLDTALARAGIARDSIASIAVRRDAREPLLVRLRAQGSGSVRVDPYRGVVVTASGSGKGQEFFSALRRWHRWIGAQGTELRAQMKIVNGMANLIFLALVLSGIYLWWPRRWTRARMKATMLVSMRGHGRVRDFNWHNALGFWAAIPLALIIASGAFISFRWPGLWLDRTLGSSQEREAAIATMNETPEQRAAREARPAGPTRASQPEPRELLRVERTAAELTQAPLSIWLDSARAARPDWKLVTLMMPTSRDRTVRVAIAEGNTYRPDQRYTLTLARASGATTALSGYADLSTGRKIRSWARFGHTGEVFGVTGQIVATLASAIGVLLVYTGFALAWRRLRSWRARRVASAALIPRSASASRAGGRVASAASRTRRQRSGSIPDRPSSY